MRTIEEIKEQAGILVMGTMPLALVPGLTAYYGIVEWPGFRGSVLFGYDEDGMEHVSVSANNKHKLPTWGDMCKLKDIFFYPEEMAVQIHPRESEYLHSMGDRDNILHLWRPKDDDWGRLNRGEVHDGAPAD